jgi:HK97 family phage major capsid protein
MTLEQLRAALREKTGALATLRAKALGADASREDIDAYKALCKEVDDLIEKIDLAVVDEAREARITKAAAAPAGAAAGAGDGHATVLGLVAAAQIKSRSGGGTPLEVLQEEGYTGLVDALMKANNIKAVNTLVSADGGILVPTAQVGQIVDLLRVQSTFLAAGPTRVQLVNGQFVLGRAASGTSASYVAEGAAKPVSTPQFDSVSMRAKKLAGIVLLTKEAQMWTIGGIEQYIRDDLQRSMAVIMDLNAYLGTGAGASPTGILNKAGVTTVTQTFVAPTAPTAAELDSMATKMILAMTSNNLYANDRWRWIMSYRTAMKLAAMRDANGNLYYPGMQGVANGQAGLSFWGFPVIVSSQIPTNGGAGTDETQIALVDFTHVLFGEEEGITMRYSDQATIDTNGLGTANVNLFQQNEMAILAESMHDFGLRFSKAVVKILAVRF